MQELGACCKLDPAEIQRRAHARFFQRVTRQIPRGRANRDLGRYSFCLRRFCSRRPPTSAAAPRHRPIFAPAQVRGKRTFGHERISESTLDPPARRCEAGNGASLVQSSTADLPRRDGLFLTSGSSGKSESGATAVIPYLYLTPSHIASMLGKEASFSCAISSFGRLGERPPHTGGSTLLHCGQSRR